MKIVLFVLLLLGMELVFAEGNVEKTVNDAWQKTRWGMETATRKRMLEARKFRGIREKNSFFAAVERELYYSGFKFVLPWVTAEIFLAGNLLLLAFITLVAGSLGGMVAVLITAVAGGLVEYLILVWGKSRNLKVVNENLMKLLDFLGNYSLTSGEVASVLFQVSRYMESPIKPVLEACYYEAQTTGDVGTALLQMTEKVEHPKFKELVSNMEISLRYCADLSALVAGSRRSMLEYLRNLGERKGMLREALISMALLLGMSFLILTAVGRLVQLSPLQLLIGSTPGRIGLALLGVIGVLFVGQMRKVHY